MHVGDTQFFSVHRWCFQKRTAEDARLPRRPVGSHTIVVEIDKVSGFVKAHIVIGIFQCSAGIHVADIDIAIHAEVDAVVVARTFVDHVKLEEQKVLGKFHTVRITGLRNGNSQRTAAVVCIVIDAVAVLV